MLHYFIIVIIVAVIIIIQINIFINTLQKIDAFGILFPGKGSFKTDETGNVRFILDPEITKVNNVLYKVLDFINTYLEKNKGAASDFHLIKDIVERNCDAEEEEINIQQPVPLYLGLMGTMAGIIVGLGYLVFSGDLKDLLSATSGSTGGVETLMGGVAIAMIASLSGIILTTIASWKAKNAKSIVEASKNNFYSWIQTELLPVLSGNAANAIFMLQQNLMNFNTAFAGNVERMDAALSGLSSLYEEQTELLKLLNNLDIKATATANVRVLKELRESTSEFQTFNRYLHRVTEYLQHVNELNDHVNEHLNRTQAIERMGDFFEREATSLDQRKAAISMAVATIDNELQKSFEALREHTESQIRELKNISVVRENELKHKLSEVDVIVEELKQLPGVKQIMSDLASAAAKQNSKLEQLTSAIRELANRKAEGRLPATPTLTATPRWLKIAAFSCIGIIALSCLFFVAMLFINQIC
jgi:hypothetical protein